MRAASTAKTTTVASVHGTAPHYGLGLRAVFTSPPGALTSSGFENPASLEAAKLVILMVCVPGQDSGRVTKLT